MILVWQITDDLPNFPLAKHSPYTVIQIICKLHYSFPNNTSIETMDHLYMYWYKFVQLCTNQIK